MKEIKLSRGMVALVDDADFEWLSHHRWHYDGKYASRQVTIGGRHITCRMHRVILDTPKGLLTDHINGDRLDNQRHNLRVVTYGQNAQNITVPSWAMSGVRNVHWTKSKQVYRVQMWVDGKRLRFGTYKSLEEAARVAEEARRIYKPYCSENSRRHDD